LGHKDSNPEKQNQNLLCYHYTMTQCFKSAAKIQRLLIVCKEYEKKIQNFLLHKCDLK
jgi:hypothetical protein